MSDHAWGNGYDRSVCEGCPHNVAAKRDTGHRLVDAIVVGIDRLTSGETRKCDLCGCPLGNLNAAQAPPTDCPRLAEHSRRS